MQRQIPIVNCLKNTKICTATPLIIANQVHQYQNGIVFQLCSSRWTDGRYGAGHRGQTEISEDRRHTEEVRLAALRGTDTGNQKL